MFFFAPWGPGKLSVHTHSAYNGSTDEEEAVGNPLQSWSDLKRAGHVVLISRFREYFWLRFTLLSHLPYGFPTDSHVCFRQKLLWSGKNDFFFLIVELFFPFFLMYCSLIYYTPTVVSAPYPYPSLSLPATICPRSTHPPLLFRMGQGSQDFKQIQNN